MVLISLRLDTNSLNWSSLGNNMHQNSKGKLTNGEHSDIWIILTAGIVLIF